MKLDFNIQFLSTPAKLADSNSDRNWTAWSLLGVWFAHLSVCECVCALKSSRLPCISNVTLLSKFWKQWCPSKWFETHLFLQSITVWRGKSKYIYKNLSALKHNQLSQKSHGHVFDKWSIQLYFLCKWWLRLKVCQNNVKNKNTSLFFRIYGHLNVSMD